MVNYKYATIEIDNEEYHYINKQWVDEGYIIPATNVLKKYIRKFSQNTKDFQTTNYLSMLKK